MLCPHSVDCALFATAFANRKLAIEAIGQMVAFSLENRVNSHEMRTRFAQHLPAVQSGGRSKALRARDTGAARDRMRVRMISPAGTTLARIVVASWRNFGQAI